MSGLSGRRALVTGVSRQVGIGAAVCRRLLADGARVFGHSWAAHDAEMAWGADDAVATDTLAAAAGWAGQLSCDLAEPAAPERLVAAAADALGSVDTLVLTHARSSAYGLGSLTAAELDLTWAVNVRASLLLVQEFARRFEAPSGRIVLFTSGQARGPMTGTIPYAASKAALRELTWTLSDALVERRITVNCLNPGPTDTGYATGEVWERVRQAFPRGRWNTPDQIAGVVSWLLSDEAAVVTGEVIDAESGFRR